MSASVAAPPGWPARVRPPGAPYWTETAVGWLLDQCPPDYRAYRLLQTHPVILARWAALHVEAQQAAQRRGISEARADLGPYVAPDVVDRAVLVCQREEARLMGLARAVGLVEDALRRYTSAP